MHVGTLTRGHPHKRSRAGYRSPSSRLPLLCLVVAALFPACAETYTYASKLESLVDGGDGRTSVAFALNHRTVKLELYLRVDGGHAAVVLIHPDGRTTEAFDVEGPGLSEIHREFDKEPGSWGLSVSANGGTVAYWAALHDRNKYLGPDDEGRRLVERR